MRMSQAFFLFLSNSPTGAYAVVDMRRQSKQTLDFIYLIL